ncbi:MAG: leucyl aminopeptidase [Proteobacteria bacterium]|nr:leucyl aminopeptidase [Pseudomonadota bacterium]
MKIAFSDPSYARTGALAVGVFDGPSLTAAGKALDKKTGGALGRAIAASRFKGGKGQVLSLLAPEGLKASRLLVFGLGKADEADDLVLQEAGGGIVANLATAGDKVANVLVERPPKSKLKLADCAANLAYGARLRSYRFDKYRTKEKEEDKPTLETLTFMVKEPAAARRAFARLDSIAEGIFFTRDLVSEPANVIYPETLAREARRLGRYGVRVEVLDANRMKQLGMGALLGVAQGSARKPRVVTMRWNGAAKGARGKRPIAFIGKGVTFDTGGISIKPSGGMEDMKYDMAGAATVIGLMRTLARRKAKVNAVGVVGLVENMPSATAQRPGDVVKSMSGQTIEVINTDAEGRLVLADMLCYCQRRFKPSLMIDLATLTGAIIVALGHEHAGLFSNDDKLAEQIGAAGKKVGETVWRLPLGEAYDKQINSAIADMKNVGSGRGGGSITAAQFLRRFVDDTPWAHLDIAGVAWSKKDAACVPKGGTGFGVRLLDRFVADNFEQT